MNNLPRPQLLGMLAGLFLAVALVLAAMIVTSSWLKISASQGITVTGSARKPVRSDLEVWRGSFSTEARELLTAQRALKADLAKVETFLRQAGVSNYLISPIGIQEIRGREKSESGSDVVKNVGFRLIQTAEVRSGEVERVTRLDRDSATLVEQGVVFTTAALEYIYTKAGEAKVEMLAEATKDARARAEQIALQGGRTISELKSAKMGVFQITPLYSLQTSWEGINDTTSLEKMVTAVVSATFSLK